MQRYAFAGFLLAALALIAGCGGGTDNPFAVNPNATINIEEGNTAALGTTLHLDALGSGAVGIISYVWAVDAPAGSAAAFEPSNVVDTVTFTPDVAGTYVFRLQIIDVRGQRDDTAAQVVVTE